MSKKILALIIVTLLPGISAANDGAGISHNDIFLALSLIIGGASLSWAIRKVGLPSVVGELGLGIVFATFAHFQWGFWQLLVNNEVIAFFAEIGSILLLFEIGLESTFSDLLKVGKYGSVTAIIGVLLPFVLGYWLLGYGLLSSNDTQLNLFLGATLAATSTGISVRVFKDMGIIRNLACQIVLAASIIDDILGLIILAFVSGLVSSGSGNFAIIGNVLFNVALFFILALTLVRKIMPFIIRQILHISNDEPMVLAILISFCFFGAWLASLIGLAPIIGAFVAGLIIDEVMFKSSQYPYWYNRLTEFNGNGDAQYLQMRTEIVDHYYHERLSNLIKPLNHAFVPIFFVYAGMQVDIMAITDWKIVLYGVVISIVAIVGKVASGMFLPKLINRWIVGFGMVPRGEIGLIFALTGRELGVFSQDLFTAILLMVIATSLVTPIALQKIIKRELCTHHT